MKKRSSILLFGLLVAAPQLAAQDIRYTTTSVRIRADATIESKVLATVPRGARVDVQACAVDWCWVEYAGKNGYLAERYLTAALPTEKVIGKGYTNSRGEEVRSPTFSASGPPAGASARCRDGTYSFSRSRRGTCSHHGGVARWL